MNHPKRRASDKFMHFSGMRDASFWINSGMLAVIVYFLMQINTDFRLLQKAVTQLALDGATRDATMENIGKELVWHRTKIDRLEQKGP